MKKTLLACMLLLVVIFSLAACSGNGTPPSNNEGSNNETSEHTHEFGEWDITVNPACTENGTKVRYCSCGEKQSESVPAIGTHTYGEWVTTKNANCGQDGEMTRHCSCGAKQTEVIHGAGMHGEVIDPAVAPTCATTGLTEGKHCPYCNTVFVVQEVIPSLEHTYNTTYSFDASFHWYACKGCGAKKDSAEHQVGANNACSICEHPIGPSVGIIYDKSADGTYAEVIGYEGTATKIRIADTYEGLPVKTIYSNAFYNNYTIKSVIIPDSVTSIGSSAFDGCRSLTSVVIPDSVTSIGSHAFSSCSRLASIVITDSVTSIGGAAFSSCSSLTSVVIGNSVTSIGSSAFSDCNSLSNVYYTGSEEEWKEITIGSSNSYLTKATRHYNYITEQ